MHTHFIAIALTISSVLSAPVVSDAPGIYERTNGGDAYTGVGGQANGGDVVSNSPLSVLNLHSQNAGAGGKASSGSAIGGAGAGAVTNTNIFRPLAVLPKPQGLLGKLGLSNVLHKRSLTSLAGINSPIAPITAPAQPILAKIGSPSNLVHLQEPLTQQNLAVVSQAVHNLPATDALHLTQRDGGAAYTGVGGQANGGSVVSQCHRQGLLGLLGLPDVNALNLNSMNAASGGNAASGSAIAGAANLLPREHTIIAREPSFVLEERQAAGGPAFTGAGGQTNGGDVVDCGGINVLNLGSKNAGTGGLANTGTAIGGHAQ